MMLGIKRVVSSMCAFAAISLGVGSCFAQSAPSADAILGKMTPEQKIDYIGGTGFAIRAEPELGLPALEMSDGPVGVRSNSGFRSTTYAGGIGLAATWNPELAEEVGAGIGKDARARGIHFMLGPGVNIYRSPRNGRNFEYFGEDPFLSAAMAVGYIDGMQKQGVSSTVKHYLGNNSEFLRHDSDSIIDERSLREIYMPAFEAAVKKAHVGAIMDSYNLTNGQHMTQNSYFNTEIARKEWGFNGVVMSDWVATYDGVAAANGGLDIEMPTGAFMNRKNLLPALKDGRVKQATIDEKVRHIVDTANRFGWLAPGYQQTDLSLSTYDLNNQEVALNAAREGIVLLKNEGKLLPLDKTKVKTILVVGPDAYPAVPVGGGSAGVVPFHGVSDLEGIAGYLGNNAVVYYERGLPTIPDLAAQTNFTTTAHGGKAGLIVQSFNNAELSGPAATTKTISHINSAGFTWQTMTEDMDTILALFSSGAKHEVSRRWIGYYTAKTSGTYEIGVQSSGEGAGSRVYLDDKLIIDDWRLCRAFQPTLTVQLSAGPHKVVVEDNQTSMFGGRIRLAIADQATLVSAAAKTLAAKADVVVVAAGFDQDSESEGSDRTFGLPFGQEELIKEISAANKNTIVAVTSGGNVDSLAWLDKVPAYLEQWYGGEGSGRALAEVLFGDVNPSGHLPATFERKAEDNPTFANYYPEGDSKKVTYKEGIFVGYRGYEKNGVKPLFPFGYGLSYTTFKYGNLTVNQDGGSGGNYTVAFDVTNTGDRAGATVAQVYVADDHTSIAHAAKQLKGFSKVNLKPGETQHLSVTLDARAFAYYDVSAKRWRVSPGNFGILVGESSVDLPLSGSVSVSAAENATLQ
ncbi:Beta-glucosidase [Acidisarcina polymorpha]|uniref:Beta-glucosidase n=1 Tax=Acidisarcina polymorpha TaxID=2211140 RepID=A0A2Z5FV31_9BACT|nr:glycoside hydrolase family 3 C-terminal domain-containing protein [Acidisarcina polymorpha]AXC10610.1 Beta-glucosidase [Acidisarcina polymorpha]